MKVYMWVSPDKYELPITIADSPAELAKIAGVTLNTVRSTIYKYNSGRTKKARFIRVKVEDDEENEHDGE